MKHSNHASPLDVLRLHIRNIFQSTGLSTHISKMITLHKISVRISKDRPPFYTIEVKILCLLGRPFSNTWDALNLKTAAI